MTQRCCQVGGSQRGRYLPLCLPGWQAAVKPNYDPSQSRTSYKLLGVIEQKITKWIDFMDSRLLNLATRSEVCHAWRAHKRNPYGWEGCKAGNELAYSKGMDVYTYQHYPPPSSHGCVYSMNCTYSHTKYWQKQSWQTSWLFGHFLHLSGHICFRLCYRNHNSTCNKKKVFLEKAG